MIGLYFPSWPSSAQRLQEGFDLLHTAATVFRASIHTAPLEGRVVPGLTMDTLDGIGNWNEGKIWAETRSAVGIAVNAGMTQLYWKIGKRVNAEILQNKRADYGAEVVQKLASHLEIEYGNGFSEKSLRRMLQFAEIYTDWQIVATLSRQLSWSHFVLLLPIKDKIQRDFYAEICGVESWSVRALRDRIGSMLYERTALSKKPEELIKQELNQLHKEGKLTPNMNVTHRKYWECPLVCRRISDTICMEFREAVDGMLVMTIISGYSGNRLEAEVMCRICPHRHR